MAYKSFNHPSSQNIWFIAKIFASYLVYGQKIWFIAEILASYLVYGQKICVYFSVFIGYTYKTKILYLAI
jgi:hypothetical protein